MRVISPPNEVDPLDAVLGDMDGNAIGGLKKCKLCMDRQLFEMVERLKERAGPHPDFGSLHASLTRNVPDYSNRGPTYYTSLKKHMQKHTRELRDRAHPST